MDYVPIRISTLMGDQKLSFNAYLKINEKMVLYIRRGDAFEAYRLERLKAKKLKKMFIENSEENQYREYMMKNIAETYEKSLNGDVKDQAAFLHQEHKSKAEKVFKNPMQEKAYAALEQSATQYVDFIISNNEALKELMAIENTTQSISHHGVSVATLCVGLAQKLNITDLDQLETLVMGATLHDFGHHNSPLYPSKKRVDMQPEEVTFYKSHVIEGAKKVQNTKHFDQVVLRIINEHEECIDGSGYPKGLMEHQLDPLSIIVATCNTLDRMIAFEGNSREEACKKLLLEYLGKYPLKHIQQAIEVMKSLG